MKVSFVIYLAFIGLVIAQKPVLLSQVNNFDHSTNSIASQLVSFDPITAQMTNIMTTFVYAEDFITINGLATLDTINNVYYYATNGASEFVYRGDVETGTLLPPVAFDFGLINDMTFDEAGKRVLGTCETFNSIMFLIDHNVVAGRFDQTLDTLVVAFPIDRSSQYGVVVNLTDLNFGDNQSFKHAVVDTNNGIYYWTSVNQINATFSQIMLNSFPFSDPSQVQSVQICGNTLRYPKRMFFDQNRQQIVMLTAVYLGGGQFDYVIERLKLGGSTACQVTQVQFPAGTSPDGDWAFDEQTQTMYTTIRSTLVTIDATTGNIIGKANINGPKNMNIVSLQFVYM